MRTTSFSRITVDFGDDEDITLKTTVPGEGSLSISMTTEELLLFIVELGNGLTASRKKELLSLQQRELKREQRRSL